MSHFTQLKTSFVDAHLLKKSLKALGYTLVEADIGEQVSVRGFFEQSQEADFKILTSSKYDVGFRLNQEGSYEVVGDWELLPQVSGLELDGFQRQLKREYARQAVLEIAEKNGYTVESVETDSGTEMVVTQW